MSLKDFVIPDRVYQVPITEGELLLSPTHDFIHHFPAIDAWMLKYWNSQAEPPTFNNIPLHEEAAQFLIDSCGLEVCIRERMGAQEHEHYLGWAATNQLSDLDFPVSDEE